MSIKALVSTLAVASFLYATIHIRGSASQVPSGTWAAGANLADPLSGASAVLLRDGRILVTGGEGSLGPRAGAELYGSGGSFSGAASMSFARGNHIAVVLQDGQVLVAGGVGTSGRALDSAEIFDPSSDSWKTVGPMMVPRSGHTASLLPDGRVLIAGGINSGGVTDTIEIFDPISGAFSLGTGVLSFPRTAHGAAALQDGRVLIVGGTDGAHALASSDIYDPSTGAISAGPSLSAPRQGPSATTELDGKVLVAGGNNGSKDLATGEIFDPASGLFIAAPSSMAVARSGHLAFLLPSNNAILIVGGISKGAPQSSTELYYPWTGEFHASGSLASARMSAAGALLNRDGLLLLAGGVNASGTVLASSELYGFATIKTDKPDYAPHEAVTISGSGWEPSEVVDLNLHEVSALDGDRKLKATADTAGNILIDKFSPNAHDVGVRFSLTATGSVSQAQISFTDKISTTTTVTSSKNPSNIGEEVTFTATVTRNTSGNGTPSRSVQFVIDGVNFGGPVDLISCGSQSACATISTSTLTAGVHTVVANYSSDVNFLSSSGTLPGGQVVSKPATTTVVTSTPAPSGYGEVITFFATLDSLDGADSATGTVIFKDGITTLGTAAVGSGGVAFLNVPSNQSIPTPLSVGTHSITAIYSGDSNFKGNTSAAYLHVVIKEPTTTTVTSTPNPAGYGEVITFFATLDSVGGANSATGTVTFKNGATVLGTAKVGSGGVAFLNVPDPSSTNTPLSVGTHSITAIYGGDGNFVGSTSAAYSQVVVKEPTTIKVTSTPSPSVYGQTVTFFGTIFSVSGADSATGTVTFKDGTTTLGTAAVGSGGVAFLNVPGAASPAALVARTHTITAVYSGNGNFAGSTSPGYSQVVKKSAVSVTIDSSLNPSVAGQTVTFTAEVSPIAPGSGTPLAQVVFLDGSTKIGAGTPLGSSGVTTFTTSALAVGTHSISAFYLGGANFEPGQSAPVSQVVNLAPTTTTVSSTPSPSVFGQTINFKAQLSSVVAVGTATGTVTFKDGTTTMGTAAVGSGGVALLNVPSAASPAALASGTHTITAVYSGDSNFAGSTSAAYSQVVQKTAVSITLESSVNPSVVGQSVTFTAHVSAVAPGSGTPLAQVVFLDGSTKIGTGTPLGSSGITTFTTSALAAGTHSISAFYLGGANFEPRQSSPVAQVVN